MQEDRERLKKEEGIDGVVPSKSLEEVLEDMPVGRFHYFLLIICGFGFMSDSLEVNLLSFLATCAGNEWGLSNSEKASISGVVFAGIIFGSTFWGSFSNIYGRRLSFLICCVIMSVAGFLTAAATNFGMLLAFRFIVGFGIGGANLSFDLLAELMPNSHRGTFLICIEYFWTFGSLFVSGMAWLLLGDYGWRVLAIVAAIPVAVTSLVSIFVLPESPMWLLTKGQHTRAEKIINDIARYNNTPLAPFTLHADEPVVESSDYTKLFRDEKTRKISILLWIVWLGFGLTYYGIILFVGRIYAKDSDDDNSDSCSFDYSALFINASSELAGVTMSALVIERLGRSNMQSLFYFIAGVASILMGCNLSKAGILVISIMGRMAIMSASNATWVATPELYSTELRTFAHAMCVSFSKFGSFAAPFIVVSDMSLAGVGIILGVVNLCAAIASKMLPETAGVDLGKVGGQDDDDQEQRMTQRLI